MTRTKTWHRWGAWSVLVFGLLVGGWTLFGAALPGAARPGPTVPDLELTLVAEGFDRPTDIASAGDTRLFLVEQPGTIRVVHAGGHVLATPFLDIQERTCTQGEGGLLGLVFDPAYAQNGYFFVNYTTNAEGRSCDAPTTRISRFQVSMANPDVADPTSERVIMSVEQPYDNHKAGDLAFGPDGFLYIPLGDGGGVGDPEGRAQNGGTLLGKVLRIAPNVVGSTGPAYTIPPTNPFVNDPNVLDEIWAIGFRNPWRFSFDRATGDLYIGDVGQVQREEINFQAAGHPGGVNYGWRCYEGTLPYNTDGCQPQASYVGPITEYSHDDGISVTGGFVYRGAAYPNMQGYYVFADFGSGRFWVLRQEAGQWQRYDQGTPFSGTSFSTFGEDAQGELYVASFDYFGAAKLYRVRDTNPQTFRLFLPLTIR